MPTSSDPTATSHTLLRRFWDAARGDPALLPQVRFTGTGNLPSAFDVSSFAAASIAVAGLAQRHLLLALGAPATVAPDAVRVDRRLASLWFGLSIQPQGWKLPPVWDPVAGDYRARDGWIRLHTNAPHHRAATLSVLGVPANREAMAQAVTAWSAESLEHAVVAAGGCAGQMRDWVAWQQHAQGRANLSEPLLAWEHTAPGPARIWAAQPSRPLHGLRVLDLTRVLAGPVATRLLAGLGADVLRIDPPGWDEPGVAAEVTPGKRCARVDPRSSEGRTHIESLLADADVLVHGYRVDVLEALGLGTEQRQRIRPGLVDVSLDAYGFSGPWKTRRGFDSIVQMSMGFAAAGQQPAPTPLPVQALDHATGYLLAAAVLRGLERRILSAGQGCIVRASLARTGAELMRCVDEALALGPATLAPVDTDDLDPAIEPTGWGPARRLHWPLRVAGVQHGWASPAMPLGSSSEARWR